MMAKFFVKYVIHSSRVILLGQNHRPTEQPLCYTRPPQTAKVISPKLKQEKMKDFILGLEGCLFVRNIKVTSFLLSNMVEGEGVKVGCKAHGRNF